MYIVFTISNFNREPAFSLTFIDIILSNNYFLFLNKYLSAVKKCLLTTIQNIFFFSVYHYRDLKNGISTS